MRKLIVLMVSLLFISCAKTYNVKFLDKNNKVVGEEQISAQDDEDAFIKAYEAFQITKKVERDMVKNRYESKVKTDTFNLYNDQNIEIKEMDFMNKKQRLDSIAKKISEIGDVIGDGKAEKQEIREIDSVKIKELMPYFNKEVDEFDVDKRKWIKPKTAAKYVNANSIYFYFSATDSEVSSLRLKIQYCAEDWLFIEKYIFNIDGFPIEFIPNEVKRDNKGGQIWEWSDSPMTGFEASLIDAIEYCKSIKIKFVGDDYAKVKNISSKEVESLKRSIKLYKAMGGSI